MAPVYHRNWKGTDRWAEDHTAEAVSVMAMEPSGIIRLLLMVLFFMLVVGVSWSFIGRLDIMVQTQGSVLPETKEKRVYVPIKGEFTDVYVSEGMPVSQGDVIARVYSPSAIELASQTLDAELALEAPEEKYKGLPNDLAAIKLTIESMTQALASQERSYQRSVE